MRTYPSIVVRSGRRLAARLRSPALVLLTAAALTGCAGMQQTVDERRTPSLIGEHIGQLGVPKPPSEGVAGDRAVQIDQPPKQRAVLYEGSGRFVDIGKRPEGGAVEPGEIVLNFQNADLREVVKVVLEDTLGLNYVVDAEVVGNVSMQTSHPLRKEDLLPTLETLLAMNGAALVERDGSYRIVPVAKAGRAAGAPRVGRGPLPPGYSIRVVPLAFIGAAEMAKVLEPVAPEGGVVRVDTLRNLLVLAGGSGDLATMLDTIQTFDVDWIEGLSVGFFSLQYASASEVAAQVQAIVGGAAAASESAPAPLRPAPDGKPGASEPAGLGALQGQGLLRVVPVEAANGLLVVTPQPEYLKKVRIWVQRLDVLGANSTDEQELYVYRVTSGEATTLAELLGRLFAPDQTANNAQAPIPAATVAPGETAVSASSRSGDQRHPTGVTSATIPSKGGEPAIGIVADAERNSLLITATPRQYKKILGALEKLDINPFQVLIEATIIEVRLTGDLRYGLQWFFEQHSGELTNSGSLVSSTSSSLSNIVPGFNFSLVSDAQDVRLLFSALAEDSLVEILSSPSVMVLDNRTARIQVGDQVPIATQQQQSTTGDSTVINSIQYRDTGIMLEVVPRVTPGGLVTMEVDQEVSDVVRTSSSDLDSPTFTTRRVTSSVAVHDGEVVVLGGLISGRREGGNGGVPYLRDLPGLGVLFSESSKSDDRTELVVILQPRVIASRVDARRVADDFRNRFQDLKGGF